MLLATLLLELKELCRQQQEQGGENGRVSNHIVDQIQAYIAEHYAEKLTLTASGSSLAINNPTPFYITVSRISRDGGKALNSKTVMLAPQSSQTVALSSAVNRGENPDR